MADKKPIVEKKDAGIAALISVVCMLVLGAPAVGYFYLGDMKKGIEYLLISWVMFGLVLGGYVVLGAFTGVTLCCFPVFVVPLIVDLLIVWDVYLEAKGEPTKLPVI
ncbi:MAG: hypothetical protein NTY73_03535 [Candidatus Micrarchaeota archaeon]|nr:hypothetical protein [Candidatus Micrarchaeota archaeon]